MNSNYDVIVIGLGPSGMMATYQLHLNGIRVLGIDRGKKYINRDKTVPFDVSNGFGGAGMYSDGKLSFYPSASKLWANCNPEELKKAYNFLGKTLVKTGCIIPKWQNYWTVHKDTSYATKKVKRYKT